MNPTENLPLHARRATWRHVLAGLIALLPVLEAEIAVPALSPRAADSPVGLDVLVTCATPGAEIRYTLNGTEPTRFDPLVASGGTVRVSRNAILKARAWAGSEASPVTTEDYRITGSIASGDQHGLALSVSGRVWSWGNQAQGRLGNGQTSAAQVLSPVQVLHGGGNFESGADLAAGFNHSLVRDQQGTVWAFGRNADGQLGVDSTTDSALPVQVLRDAGLPSLVPLDNVVAVAAGQDWSLALAASGEPLSWGRQATGRLGSGSISGSRLLPGPVLRGDLPAYPALTGMRSIAAAPAFGLAREANDREQPGDTGKVWSWGYNNTGQLGHGGTSTASRALPVKLDAATPLTDAWDLAAGEAHTAIIRWHPTNPALQGSVWAAGNRAYGRLGNGSTAAGSVSYPTPVLKSAGVPLDGIGQVAAGAAHTLALDEAGFVWSWGYNGYGQLGDGSTTNRAYAAKVKSPAGTGDLAGIVRVAAGGDGLHGASMALAADGTIYVWGRNHQGQLGNGETSLYATKLPVAHAQNHVVEGAPALTLTHNVTAAVEAGSVAITAFPSHTGPGGVEEIDRVELFLNGQLAVTFSGGIWLETVSGLAAGEYHGYGVVVDDDGVRAMSAPFTFEIALHPAGDKDGDGLTNGEELSLGTNPWNADTDGDGMEDGYEHWHQFSPLVIEIGTNGPDGDADNDQVTNKLEHDSGSLARLKSEKFNPTEFNLTGTIRWFARKGFWYTPEYSTTLTSWTPLPGGIQGENQEVSVNLSDWYGAPLPLSSFYVRMRYGPTGFHDSDGDGLSDFVESLLGLDAAKIDSDDDGLPDGDEDTDGDGITNQSEVEQQTDPTDSTQFPPHYLIVNKGFFQTWSAGSPIEVGDPQGYYELFRSWNSTAIWDFLYETPFSDAELNAAFDDVDFPATPPANAKKILMNFVPHPGRIDTGAGGIVVYPGVSADADATSTRVWLRMPLPGGTTGHSTRAFLRVTTGGVADDVQNQDHEPVVEIVEASFAPGSELSSPLDLQPPVVDPQSPNVRTWSSVVLLSLEVAPDKLASNGDFNEGDTGATSAQTTGALPDNRNQTLIAARNSADGRISAGDLVTEDLHEGWLGLLPDLMPDEFFDGATITITKLNKTDPATGEREEGTVRFFATWGENEEVVIHHNDPFIDSMYPNGSAPKKLVSKVYGANKTIPSEAKFWIEGVSPGKITLEWRYQKGDIDINHEQIFEIGNDWSKEKWQKSVRDEIYLDSFTSSSGSAMNSLTTQGVDADQYAVANDFLPNRPYIYSVYEYYAKLHRDESDKFLWAGLAKQAGAPVYAGLSDAQNGRRGEAILTWGNIEDTVLKEIQDILVQANIEIYNDLAYQFAAYRAGGIGSIGYLARTQGIEADSLEAWIKIDEVNNVSEGNKELLERDQSIILQQTYIDLDGLAFGVASWLFSVLAENPVPLGPDFKDVVPSGNIATFNDRWQWITNPGNGMWPLWMGESEAQRIQFSNRVLTSYADTFNLLAPLR